MKLLDVHAETLKCFWLCDSRIVGDVGLHTLQQWLRFIRDGLPHLEEVLVNSPRTSAGRMVFPGMTLNIDFEEVEDGWRFVSVDDGFWFHTAQEIKDGISQVLDCMVLE